MQSLRSPVIELWERVVDSRLNGKATAFQKRASEIRLRQKNSQDPQVLTRRILKSPR